MVLREVLERIATRAPACLMMRALLENVFAAERLDRLFEETAQVQENKTLLFSTVADIMGLVAMKIQPSVHAAFLSRREEIGVTAKAIYDKLQRIEPCVSQMMVRDSAIQLAAIAERLKHGRKAVLPGYRVKIVDGNHFRRTQRRLQELRTLNAAPLPGQCLVVLDPQAKLAIDMFPCEDGHAQERSMLSAVLETVKPGDLWVADRNFCTQNFLLGIKDRRAYFLIRQHANALHSELVGKRKKAGRTDTGMVFEQTLRLLDDKDNEVAVLRRITVELDQPTRDAEYEVHVLTNLPRKVSAQRVADLYRKRWNIETAFQEMAENLAAEIETLGYPRAALFAFSMGLVAFNLLSVIQSALRDAHPEHADQISTYYLCDEIAHTYRGLDLAMDPKEWTRAFGSLTAGQLARKLAEIAGKIAIMRYRTHKRGPKNPPPKMNKKKRTHISTARVLTESRGQNC